MSRKTRIPPKYIPYLLISPALLYYLSFWFFPVLTAVKESFTDNAGIFTLNNFKMTFQSEFFSQAVLNTVVFAGVSIFLQYFLALAVAFLVNRKFNGSKFVLFLAMIPMSITPTAVAILWRTGLMETGWINSLLMTLHFVDAPIIWLGVRGIEAVLLISLIDTWTVMPSVMIILLAGLQGMQKEYKEAGLVFGATKWQVTKDIVLPILKPSIVTSIILRLIAAVQVWAITVMVFGFNKVPFLVERIAYYVNMVPNLDYSMKIAFCLSLLVAAGVMGITFVYYKISKKDSVMEDSKQ